MGTIAANNNGGIKPYMIAVFVTIVWLCIVLSSCTTTKYIEVPKEVVKTEYRDRLQKDTMYVKDSIFVKQKGDTIYIDKWHTQYVEKVRIDTCTIDHYSVETKVITQEKQLTKWESFKMNIGGYCLFLLLLIIVGCIVYVVIKIKKVI